MSIQGQTRIELTDIHTGRTRVWEHKNRVTDALQEIFTPFGLYTDSRMLEPQGGEDANSPLLFASGGVLLLDKAVGADEDALLLPAGTAVTGSGACGQTNAGENRVRGSFNAVESQLDPAEGQLTFVYDFSTQQANGTVASICLTHRGGAMLASEDTHASADHYAYEAGETFGGQLSRGFLTFLDAETDLPYLLEMDEEADELLLARPAAGADGTLQLTLEAYPAYTRSLDLFWQRGTNKPPCKRSQTVTVQPLLKASAGTAYFLGWNYRPETRTLYITNTSGTQVAANAAFQVLAVSLDTRQVTVHSLTNQTGVALAGSGAGSLRGSTLSMNLRPARPLAGFVYDGAVYMRSYQRSGDLYRYFRIPLTDAGDVTEIDCAGLPFTYVNDAYAGRLYSYAAAGVGEGSYGAVLDTAKNRMRRTEVYSSGADYLKIYPIRGRQLLCLACRDNGDKADGVVLSVRANYLATVNDLAEPVEKTADKTMKVTYILRRTAGADSEGGSV